MTDFLQALHEAGYNPPHPIRDDGRFQRFGPKLAHWLVYDGTFGAAGDWRGQNPQVRWKDGFDGNLTYVEKRHLSEQAKAAFEEYRNDRDLRAQETAERAIVLWSQCKKEGASAYLTRKQVPAIDCRFGHEPKSNRPYLAVPVRDMEGNFWNLQKIYDDGTKLFLKGGRKLGCFHVLGSLAGSDRLYFCEGYATGASVHAATGKTAVVCFDAGNLAPVVASFRTAYPARSFIIAADNDAHGKENIGKREAEKAAVQSGSAVILPRFRDEFSTSTDFNDLHMVEGLDEVRRQLNGEPKAFTVKAPDPWPDPDMSLVDADQVVPPAFDPGFLPQPWVRWVVEQAEAVGCPVDYVAAALLASASAWIGNSRRVAATSDWIEPPHLWFALIGMPSTGKTPAQRPFIDACKFLEIDERPAWRERMAEHTQQADICNARREQWKVEVRTAIKNKATLPPQPEDSMPTDPPGMPRIVINDSTIEEVTNILAHNPKGLLMLRDELAGWIGSFDRYGGEGSDRAFYLECWNGGSHTVDRVKKTGQPVEVAYASLAILGGIQPDKLRDALAGADDGFTARPIYIWPAPCPFRPLGVNNPGNSDERRNWLLTAARRMRQLQMEQTTTLSVKFRSVPLADTVAFDVIRQQAMEKARSTHGLISGWHGKTPARALRLALVMEYLAWAVSDGQPEPQSVTSSSIASAGAYLSYAEKMFERSISGLGISRQENDAALIARHIMASPAAQINERQLYQTQGFAHLRDSQRRKEAFATLERMGWIMPASRESKGRPRSNWLVNPKLISVQNVQNV
jgi:phage/plasmid primase-like uncharacterized protein